MGNHKSMKKSTQTKCTTREIYHCTVMSWVYQKKRKLERYHFVYSDEQIIYHRTEAEIIEYITKTWYSPLNKIKIKQKRLHDILYVKFEGIDIRYNDNPPFYKWIAIV